MNNIANDEQVFDCSYICENSIILAGIDVLCNSSNYYLINAPTNVPVSWSVFPSAAASISGSGSSITLTRNGSYNGTVTLKATVGSACGTVNFTKNITVGKPSSPSGFTSVIVDPYMHRIRAQVTPVSGATSYKWFLGSNLMATTSGTLATITIPNDCSIMDYSIGVKAVNNCDDSPPYYELHENPCYDGGDLYSVSPNPASTTITLSYNASSNVNGTASSNTAMNQNTSDTYIVFDLNGIPVLNGIIETEITYLDVTGLVTGHYILMIYFNEGEEESHHIIVN